MNRGEVYEYTVGSRRARIVVVSASRYNPGLATFAVIRQPTTGPVPTSIVVPITAPVAGAVDLARLRPLDPTAVGAHLGRLTATAQRAVDNALRTYLDLAL